MLLYKFVEIDSTEKEGVFKMFWNFVYLVIMISMSKKCN